MEQVECSLVVPIYKNEGSMPSLIKAVTDMKARVGVSFEAVFVIDGISDRSLEILRSTLPTTGLRSSIVVLSRNYGSFSAIRAGLSVARGKYLAVMAADLQEPPELIIQFFEKLRTGNVEVVVGVREARDDPWHQRLLAMVFWYVYRKLAQRDMPQGGIDIFGCSQSVRDQLLALNESNTTLVGLLLWLGFRREALPYRRQPRLHGKSAWSFRRKVRYMFDSIFAFTDIPIRALTVLGLTGLMISLLVALTVFLARVTGFITVPGYAGTVIIVAFLGGLNSFGMGIVGEYLWRTFENTKQRPGFIIQSKFNFD